MSDFMKLNGRDFAKGMIVAALAAAFSAVGTILDTGALPTGAEWLAIAKVTAMAAVSYLTKNFFTNSQDQLAKEQK